MNALNGQRMRVAVIGAGISGLSAAHHLIELRPELDLRIFDSAERAGGVLQTTREGEFLIERSADNFITNVPWASDLCRRIGLADEMLATRAAGRRALVARGNRVLPIPAGFLLLSPGRIWPVLTTPLLSVRGKARLLAELFVAKKTPPGDESLASFARRRLGDEAFANIVQPLVGGIYTADPEKLSVAATMPQFLDMEQRHGSLIRAALRARKSAPAKSLASGDGAGDRVHGARYGLFTAPRQGMTQMINAILARLPENCLHVGATVSRVERSRGGNWGLTVSAGNIDRREDFHAVIAACPAPRAADLLADSDRELAAALREIAYAGASVVVQAYRREQFRRWVNGFGFVVPSNANRKILSSSFSSEKYPGRAPDGAVLIRTFVGGACQAELLDLDDSATEALVARELRDLLGLEGGPQFSQVVRWKGVMPQYHVGHLERVAQIESRVAAIPGLELAGNAYRGVGIPQCVYSGEEAARRTIAYLTTAIPTTPMKA